jgi:hypothetical protein
LSPAHRLDPSLAIPTFGGKAKGRLPMRTITAYGIAVIIVFAILNGIFWLVGNPKLHDLNVFSAGFILGMLGMYIAAWLYGYRRVAID